MLRIAKLHVRFATFPARLVLNHFAKKHANKHASKKMMKNYETMLKDAIAQTKLQTI